MASLPSFFYALFISVNSLTSVAALARKMCARAHAHTRWKYMRLYMKVGRVHWGIRYVTNSSE